MSSRVTRHFPPGRTADFAEELLRFSNQCQVLAGSVTFSECSHAELIQRMLEMLPRPHSPADFILLRTILANFLAHGDHADPIDVEHTLDVLLHVSPRQEIGTSFLTLCKGAQGTSSRQLASDGSKPRWRAERAMSVLLERCDEPDLTISAVASGAGVSPDYARKLLHSWYGIGFRAALRRARVSLAQDLLDSSAASIKEIAARVGYNTTSRFDQEFKRECGVAPGEFRLRLLTQRKGTS